jgi:hypothetical protein
MRDLFVKHNTLRVLNSARILTLSPLLSTKNLISQKYLYILCSYNMIQENLKFVMPSSLCDDMLQSPPRRNKSVKPTNSGAERSGKNDSLIN